MNNTITHTYKSGNIKSKADFYVEYTPTNLNGIILNIHSKTTMLHGKKLKEIIHLTLSDLGINKCKIEVVDNGGQYFVLQARIEAAIKLANPNLTLESLPKIKQHSTYNSSRERFRRSRLYIPGNQAKLMLNAGIHKPDGIILDLEDSVSQSEKSSARIIVRNALRQLNFFNAERMVRINQGDLGLSDLKSIIPHNVHLILIPKVESAQELIKIDKHIIDISKRCGRKDDVYLMPILESASGIINAFEIANASRNNVGIAIGLEDYTADIGVERTNEGNESLFARSQLINAARSANIQAIDTVFSDVNDDKALRESVKEAKNLGFDGKGCIHPRQIKPIHEEFAPSRTQIEKAKKIVLAYDEAKKNDLGVVSLGSKMIDPPVVKRALNIIKIATSMNLLTKKWKQK